MPRYMVETPYVHETVVRPIVRRLAIDVLDNYGLRDEAIQFVFLGQEESLPTTRSTLHNKDEQLRLESDARVEIEYEEEVVNPLGVAKLRQEQRLVFLDDELRVWIKPMYVETELTLSFRIITKDRTTASLWYKRAQRQSMREYHTWLTNLEYHYVIPMGFMKQLNVIHTLRERSGNPKNENFGKWLKRCFVKQMSMLSNQANKQTNAVIAQTQTRVMPWFTHGHDVEKIERANDAGGYQAQFSVKLHFDKPESVIMGHPLIIHNQLIPKEYRDDTPSTPVDYFSSRSLSLEQLGHFEDATQYDSTGARAGIPIPFFDDWFPRLHLPRHVNTTRILVTLLENEPNWYFTFDEDSLGEYAIKPSTLAYLKDCQQMLLKPYDSLFNISLHEWYSIVDYKRLDIDENLKFTSKFDGDLTKMYHVVVNMLIDLAYLSEKGRKVLFRHGQVLKDWAQEVWPGSPLANIHINDDGSVNGTDVDAIIEEMVKTNKIPHIKRPLTPNTFNGFTVIARKKDTL